MAVVSKELAVKEEAESVARVGDNGDKLSWNYFLDKERGRTLRSALGVFSCVETAYAAASPACLPASSPALRASGAGSFPSFTDAVRSTDRTAAACTLVAICP